MPGPDKFPQGVCPGAEDAPVAIVEFSDFQCPYCKAVLPAVNEIMARYPEKMRWIFRDFPIETLHPTAPKAMRLPGAQEIRGNFGNTTTFFLSDHPATLRSSSNNTPGKLGLTARRSPNAWKVANTRQRLPVTSRKEYA